MRACGVLARRRPGALTLNVLLDSLPNSGCFHPHNPSGCEVHTPRWPLEGEAYTFSPWSSPIGPALVLAPNCTRARDAFRAHTGLPVGTVHLCEPVCTECAVLPAPPYVFVTDFGEILRFFYTTMYRKDWVVVVTCSRVTQTHIHIHTYTLAPWRVPQAVSCYCSAALQR